MKKVEDCSIDNCIPTPSSCVDWSGGDIEFLGICNGDKLNNLVWEIVNKLKDVAGEDISSFDVDEMLAICNQKAPLEINLISILTIIKNTQVCLKDYIDTLNSTLAELSSSDIVKADLKCFADIDNIGNVLSVTRDAFDQILINNLCNHKQRIESLEGEVTSLQSQIDNFDTSLTVEELSISTCINGTSLPTSTQVQNTAQAVCDLEGALGDETDISAALGNTPGDLNGEFGLITGWNLTPSNMAENYSNLLLEVENLRQRIKLIENNCCAVTCKDVELGFTAIFNEDQDGIIIKFTSGAGTFIPVGFTSVGSTGVITDIDGNTQTFDIVISNNSEDEVLVSGLNLNGDLEVDITAILTTGSLTCEKCLHKTVKSTGCGFCEITATGEDGSAAVIIYSDGGSGTVIETPTSTTTTTTVGL